VDTSDDWRVITVKDWALIRRLAADGMPKAGIARKLGVSRTTVLKAVASERPPKYERALAPTSFTPFEVRVRQLLLGRALEGASDPGVTAGSPCGGPSRQGLVWIVVSASGCRADGL
jgi:hypothetical protein